MELNQQELNEIINPGKTVLLVWDVQNRLVQGIFNTEEFLSNTKKVISAARSNGVPVVFSKSTPLPEKFESPVRKFLYKKMLMNIKNVPDGPDLTIIPEEGDMVIPKNTASMFIGTNFEQLLMNAGIKTIVFTGISTEGGIESSARDASNRGFFPVIISDAVSSFNQEAHNRSLENMKNMMIVLKADELGTVW